MEDRNEISESSRVQKVTDARLCVVHFCVAGFLAAAAVLPSSCSHLLSVFYFSLVAHLEIPFWGWNYPPREGIVSGSHFSANMIVNYA
jgi:hypothetical protein